MKSDIRRSRTQQQARVPAGALTWLYERQYDEQGGLLFAFASSFQLDGADIDDRLGERTLDRHNIRTDGTLRADS